MRGAGWTGLPQVRFVLRTELICNRNHGRVLLDQGFSESDDQRHDLKCKDSVHTKFKDHEIAEGFIE